MLSTLILAGLAVAVLAGHKKASGVGAVKKAKRRIYQELADAQKLDIDFTKDASSLSEGDINDLKSLAAHYGWKQSAASVRSGKSFAEAYFNNLKKAYNAISGIGSTSLPYHESVVYNENGDEIMRYRNYGTDAEKMRYALAWFLEMAESQAISRTADYAFNKTVWSIATGTKFVWKGKKKGGMYVYRGILEELFGSGEEGKYSAPASRNEERKARISYLGSYDKGAFTPVTYIELISVLNNGHDLEFNEVTTGVHDALREFTSVGQAREAIMRAYIDEHTNEEYADEHVPF